MEKSQTLCVLLLVLLTQYTTAQVGIILESRSLALSNNSIVSSSDIGSSFGQALQCYSNDTVTFNIGEWLTPDQSRLGVSSSDTVYNLRGPGVVRLYRTRELTPELEGVYTCRIPDSNGRVHVLYTGIYRENNLGSPVIPASPSFTLLTPYDQHPPMFTLSCTSTSYPSTMVSWLLNGELLDTYNDQDFDTTQVLLDPVSTMYYSQLTVFSNYSGVYECLLNNSVGISREMYEVTEPVSPPMLQDPMFLGSGDVNITWTRPEGPVYGYQLFYKLVSPDSGSELLINITSPNVTHVVLKSLKAGATYDLSVLAYADLPTERSDTLPITLNVAGFAENVSISYIGPTSVNISWNHTGENVVDYIIEYEPTGYDNCPGVSSGLVKAPSEVTTYTIPDLEEYTQYNITIRTVSEAAVGDPSYPVITRTAESPPSAPPSNVTVEPMDPDTFLISWFPPSCENQNGPITSYTLLFIDQLLTQTGGSRIQGLVTTKRNISEEVNPFRNISFQVSVLNDAGESRFSTPVYSHLIANPGKVRTFFVTSNRDLSSIQLRWLANPLLGQFVNGLTYEVAYGFSGCSNSKDIIGSMTDLPAKASQGYTVTGLAPNTTYRFCVLPISTDSRGTKYRGEFEQTDGTTTVFAGVTEFSVVQRDDYSVNVSWTPIPSRDIIFYEIYYNSTDDEIVTVRVNLTQSLPVIITDLNHELLYDFSVAGYVYGNGTNIRGPVIGITGFSLIIDDNTILYIIIVCSSVGGILILIAVIAVTVFFLTILSKNLGPELANKNTSEVDYIPLNILEGAIEGLEEDQVDSSGVKPSGGGRSAPSVTGGLSGDIHSVEGQEVVIRYTVHGEPKPSVKWMLDNEDLDWDTSSIIQRDSTLIFKRVEIEHTGEYKLSAVNANGRSEKRVKLIVYPDTEVSRHPEETQAVTSVKITVDNLGQYVAGLHANGNKLFREQFRMLSSGEAGRPIKEVLADEFRPYNRFQHILVYDDNRIKLNTLTRYMDCHHEYINACYVKGEGEKCRQFISTQGPLDHSVADMWRLVWQEKAPVIVMLTKTKEDLRIKCAQYWPSKGTSHYGPFSVTLLEETTFTGYTVREFSVHFNSISTNIRSRIANPTGKTSVQYKEPFSNVKSTLRVTQYHYHDWMEHGTAENIPSLLEMHMKATSRPTSHPIVVHCSNGVGRTGAFIAMDMVLEQAKQGSIDVPAAVLMIRRQRMKMIQTLDQFMLVHDAIIEKIICGENFILVKNLRSKLAGLDVKEEGSHMTGYERQFNVIQQITVSPDKAVCSYAKQFPKKNREGHALPTNQWRVALKGESPDYINATSVLGYNIPRGFIITQGPLRDTRRDFWKMVHDQEITTIVMLSSLMENDKEICSQYWPSTGNIEFGEFLIFVKDSFENDGFTRRILILKELKTNSLRRVVQYQVKGWDPGNNCNNMIGVVNTINLVATIQRKTPNIPILVHCSNGIGRSAMFCIAMATIERCKVEGVIDVFQLVKKMRDQLPGAIQDKNQYKLIHQLMAAYLNVFSTTANFDQFEI